ncbi:MAG: hypothetical protein M3680_22415 [Myxococcota bacterium]|nr:hypothetical protein [Myxococcota bacterium]
MSSSALDAARARSTEAGGTIGEQLVDRGEIADDALTDFYRSRLLVPQVSPNTLARLPVKVIAAIPSDMAIQLRAIPIALDNDNNLTVAMSDPSDRHAVDEIAFFTGTYVVRAVATQMQIAWCLAHYYGHLTVLGHKLLQQGGDGVPQCTPVTESSSTTTPIARTKGETGRVEAARHHGVPPITGPHDAPRPNSGELDLPPVEPVLRAQSPALDEDDGVVQQPRARSISGEIRVPGRRAASIRPPMPEHEEEDTGPIITIEAQAAAVAASDDDPTGPRKLPVRRRKARTDPPELAARAGEVQTATAPVRLIDDEPRIIIAEEVLAPPVLPVTSGELSVISQRDEGGAPATTIEVDDTSVGVLIHEHYRRAGDDGDGDEIVELAARKPVRPDKRTQAGVGAIAATTRAARDTEVGGVPDMVEDGPTRRRSRDTEATRPDARATTASTEDTTDESLAAPPSPDGRDTGTHVAAPPPPRAASSPVVFARAVSPDHGGAGGDDDDGDGPFTAVMTAAELDDVIPERSSDVVPGHLDGRRERVDYDAVDDGWGPPGTTIPPPLLGAIPGSDDDEGDGVATAIPLDVNSAPLIVAPPSPPEASRSQPIAQGTGTSLVRALEESTSRSIALINALELATDRNGVVSTMITHLAESHRRAGFFALKPGADKANELALFALQPPPGALPTASLRLDRASTLQDVVGTRLPYRGPMHDESSQAFLASILGACPPEILLVPVAIRERVVGVLFGEHRLRHTFDDQLALAARAAGMALERILKTRRG